MDPTAEIKLKTMVNTRAPLASRLPKNKLCHRENADVKSLALHHTKETTYDIDYVPFPEAAAPAFIFSGMNADAQDPAGSKSSSYSTANHPNAAERVACGGGGPGQQGSGDDQASTAGGGTTKENISSPQPPFSHIGAYKVKVEPSSQWESEAHAATRGVQPEQILDFYSTVRKMEAKDDEVRGARVGSVQRSLEITMKRATDPAMRYPTPKYCGFRPSEFPIVAAHERQILKKNYLDLVDCQHLDPDTEQQIAYDRRPEDRLPGLDLSQDHPTQSKAITRMATSEELFRGYPKFVNKKPVSYAGHIPMHPRNLEAMQAEKGEEDVRKLYSTSIMTLATHGGGVDSSLVSTSLRARQRQGKNAPACTVLKPKSDDTIRKMVEGRMLQNTLYNATEKEKAMNFRDDKRGCDYF